MYFSLCSINCISIYFPQELMTIKLSKASYNHLSIVLSFIMIERQHQHLWSLLSSPSICRSSYMQTIDSLKC
ncbi:uncharacterized protein J3R85_014465 [Psidium guajava]|nr:uncharacterized protein J3R85_014465 [Psidium guajava]